MRIRTGETVPIWTRTTADGSTLIECPETAAFLDYILPRHDEISREIPDTCVRGVVSAGDGAIFQVFDQFGCLVDDEVRLDPEGARRLLAEIHDDSL